MSTDFFWKKGIFLVLGPIWLWKFAITLQQRLLSKTLSFVVMDEALRRDVQLSVFKSVPGSYASAV